MQRSQRGGIGGLSNTRLPKLQQHTRIVRHKLWMPLQGQNVLAQLTHGMRTKVTTCKHNGILCALHYLVLMANQNLQIGCTLIMPGRPRKAATKSPEL